MEIKRQGKYTVEAYVRKLKNIMRKRRKQSREEKKKMGHRFCGTSREFDVVLWLKKKGKTDEDDTGAKERG